MSYKIAGVEVTHLTHDSREVKPGSCFFALPGGKTNGSMYVLNAVSAGAAVIVAEQGQELPEVPVPILRVDNVRESMALAAKRFYGDICDKMQIIGITGTNGKTTCTYILRQLLEKKGASSKGQVGVIGTLGAFIGDEQLEYGLTTPDPIRLHEIFQIMYDRGVRVIAMEVSAHAIHYRKVAGINFRCGIFTNLSQDHLDFFPTYEDYAMTKVNWVAGLTVQTTISNADDEYGRMIIEKHPNVKKYSINDVADLQMHATCSVFKLEKHKIRLNMGGRFNVYNALACITAVREIGLPWRKIKKRLAQVKPVPGRFNVIKSGKGTSVVIDYAHTPDSLENILTTARELVGNGGRLISVFGCGGNRDKDKRSKMGKISGDLADFTVVTSDNPRDESPASILLQIEAGLKTVTKSKSPDATYTLIEDRKDATHFALDMAKPGDVIVIAGKGAETTQEIAGVFHPYIDSDIVRNYFTKGI